MAGNNNGDGVIPVGKPHGPEGFWIVDLLSYLTIGPILELIYLYLTL